MSNESKGKMKIVFLHGLESKPTGAKIDYLRTLGEVFAPKIDYKEVFVDKYLPNIKLELCEIDDLVNNCEIIFVPIQTPHEEKYEGITRIPQERADFDYSYLKSGMKALNASVEKLNKEVVVIIISTVLPGTIRREIKPLLSKNIKLCYNPFFIAMGSTINDFLFPEFILFGKDDIYAAELGKKFLKQLQVHRYTILP